MSSSNYYNPNDLESVVRAYAQDKSLLDSYKKQCETENNLIKKSMTERGLDEITVDDITIKRIIQHKESIDAEKLLSIAHKYNLTALIKTREYVDLDALETFLYNTDIQNGEYGDLSNDLTRCRNTQEVVTLRISKKKIKGSDI